MNRSGRFLVAALLSLGVAASALSATSPSANATAAMAEKGDLPVGASCQLHPAGDCPVQLGAGALFATRTITVGHQVGEATSVLIRIPAAQVAAR